MVDLVNLLQRVYEELVDVCSSVTDVADPNQHADVLDRSEPIETPFFGFEWTINTKPMGMGGHKIVVDELRDGDHVEYTVALMYTLTLDLAVIVDGDEPRTRSSYMSAVQSHFADFISNPEQLHDDVERVREQNTVPSPAGQTGDVSARTTFEVEFAAYTTATDPAAATVNLGVDANDIDAYPENY